MGAWAGYAGRHSTHTHTHPLMGEERGKGGVERCIIVHNWGKSCAAPIVSRLRLWKTLIVFESEFNNDIKDDDRETYDDDDDDDDVESQDHAFSQCVSSYVCARNVLIWV